MTIGEALDQYVAKLDALERTVAELSNQVFRLEGDLAEIKRLVFHPVPVTARPSGMRITHPSVASQIRAAVDPPPMKVASIDLNAEFPEGSTVLMSGDFEKDGKAAPAYDLRSLKAIFNPLPSSQVCNVRGECSLKVVDLDHGDTCPHAVTRCVFNKAHA